MDSSTSESLRRSVRAGDFSTIFWAARQMQRDAYGDIGRALVRAAKATFARLTRRNSDLGVEMLSRRQLADIGMTGRVRPREAANDIDRGLAA